MVERIRSDLPPMDEAAVCESWDANAESWARQVRAGNDRYRDLFNNPLFFAFVPQLAGLSVIDLGCGEGHNTRTFARKGARMTGIDLSPRMIAAAREAEAADPLGIEYRTDSFAAMEGVADGSFDAAVSTMALMDGPDFAAAARATHRVLRPGGGFYFSVIHPCFVTPGDKSGWLRDADGKEQGLIVADYFDDAAYVERWRFKRSNAQDEPKFTVPRFPHRLETYVNGLCDAGFRITRIQEARPTEAMAAEHAWLARLRRHAAIFLYVAARKD